MDDSGWRREKREGRNELVPPVVVMVVVAVFVEERSWDYTRLRYDTILTLPFFDRPAFFVSFVYELLLSFYPFYLFPPML